MTIASLDKNIENMFNMLNEILTIPNFSDHSTLSKLMNFYGAEEFSNMIENSLEFAISLSVIKLFF